MSSDLHAIFQATTSPTLTKPEERRPLGKFSRRWKDNIKMELKEVVWGGTDWVDLAQDRDRWRALVNAVMNLQVP
jgi:hypothetical protein